MIQAKNTSPGWSVWCVELHVRAALLFRFFSPICFYPCTVVLGDGCRVRLPKMLSCIGVLGYYDMCEARAANLGFSLRQTAHRQCVRSAKADKDENRDENGFAALDEAGMCKARHAYSPLLYTYIVCIRMYASIYTLIYRPPQGHARQ